MDLQLNAVESDASAGENSPSPAPPAFALPVSRISASTGASLASILSAESPQTPQNPSPPPRFQLPVAGRTGLLNLMNSPMVDTNVPQSYAEAIRYEEARATEISEDAEMKDAEQPNTEDGEDMEDEEDEDASTGKRRRGYSTVSERSSASSPPPQTVTSPASIAINSDALAVQDSELGEVKNALQTAIERYVAAESKAKSSAVAAAKRARKVKSKKKTIPPATSPAAVADSLAEVSKCIEKLQDKITTDLFDIASLRDIVRVSLAFLDAVVSADPVTTSAADDSIESRITRALSNLQSKPVHIELASTVRRAVTSVPEESTLELLADVLERVQASSNDQKQPASEWCWLFVFLAQFDAHSVVEFAVEYIVREGGADRRQDLLVQLLEYQSIRQSATVVDVITKTLQRLAGGDDNSVRIDTALVRLLDLVLTSRKLLQAVDESFQWLVTQDIVVALWERATTMQDSAAHSVSNGSEPPSLFSRLLQTIDNHAASLPNASFQLALLLQQLIDGKQEGTRRELAKIASKFHADLVRMAQNQPSLTLLRGIHRMLPYIVQCMMDDLVASVEEEKITVESGWTSWLMAVASLLSRQDVTNKLLQADLTLCTMASRPPVPVDVLADLLCTIVEPASAEFAVMVREISTQLQLPATSDSTQRRLLSLIECLVERSSDTIASSLQLIPLQLDSASNSIDELVGAFSHMTPWHESWRQLELWCGASGADLWEYLLDLVAIGGGNKKLELTAQALQLLVKTPFPSLEDPVWQLRCLRKLTTVYFHALKQYRAAAIDASVDSQQDTQRWLAHVQSLRTVVTRVVSIDGAVAHYASSVSTQFTALWLDALFSTASATSVPTHFPSSRKAVGEFSQRSTEEHAVIRSERTISSKCTNLQSSQVITNNSETRLVYRKALDDSWEREMEAAQTCSVLATSVLTDLLMGSVPASLATDRPEEDRLERRLKGVVDMLLERAIPCCGIPSDDVYKEFLPNRSSFDMDLRIEQWLNHFPAFLQLVKAVVEATCASPASTQSLRLLPLIKSALVVLLGHWNSVKGDLSVQNLDVPPYMRNQNQLAMTCELMRILRTTRWLPEPLARTAELLPLTTPADIRSILFSCWFYLADHPPATAPPPTAAGKMPIEFYLLPIRKALQQNIHKVGAKYPMFMC